VSSDLTIDRVEVLDLRDRTGDGDDGLFVGLHGAGRTGWYGPMADEPAHCIDAGIAEVVIGEPFTDHDALNTKMRQAIGPCPRVAASWAIGALDCAAWDLHGQLAGVPAANLMASPPSQTVPVYASWLRLDLLQPSTTDTVARVSSDGWLFTKWGLRRTSERDPRTDAAQLALAVRRVAAGLSEKPAFDAVFTWDPEVTEAFADAIDPGAIRWLEDPLPHRDLAVYPKIEGLGLPLAIGERLTIGDHASVPLSLDLQAFTLDVVGCGGLTRAAHLVADAGAAGIPVFPHGRSMVPAVHLAAAYPGQVAAVEYQVQWEPVRQRLYVEPWQPVRGRIAVPNTPGLGITPRSR
jgi:L-alanine-DL-glutamate epimerase-like enolase superfamily enzyme